MDKLLKELSKQFDMPRRISREGKHYRLVRIDTTGSVMDAIYEECAAPDQISADIKFQG